MIGYKIQQLNMNVLCKSQKNDYKKRSKIYLINKWTPKLRSLYEGLKDLFE